jgi:uncharacterized glyoxalase superfamily protein PhnB
VALDNCPHALVLRYRDPAHAVAWICRALGFSRTHVDCDAEGQLQYAQLRLGNALVIVAQVGNAAFDGLMRQPEEVGGAVTNIPYFVVDNIDAHYVQARASGAAIAVELGDYDGGGRGYTCKDPEGHAWSFGSYNPWIASAGVPPGQQHRSRLRRLSASPAAILLTGALALAGGGGWLAASGSLRGDPGPAPNHALQMKAEVAQALEESGVLRDALAESVSREIAARSALQSSEMRLRALTDQLETAEAAVRARDDVATSLQKRVEDANSAKAQLAARAEQAEADAGQERRLKAMAEKQAGAGRTALEEQQRRHRAAQEAAQKQYDALSVKLAATEQAHRLALNAYEELVQEKASATIEAKPAEAERLASAVRSTLAVRGTASKREVKPVASRSASTAEPRWDRARRRCAEVRRNPDDYEPELVQLCRAL